MDPEHSERPDALTLTVEALALLALLTALYSYLTHL